MTHRASSLDAADILRLAASPTFAIMAVLTAFPGAEMCSAAQGASPLRGMVPMYVLMSVFHAVPWLKVISGQQRDVRRS